MMEIVLASADRIFMNKCLKFCTDYIVSNTNKTELNLYIVQESFSKTTEAIKFKLQTTVIHNKKKVYIFNHSDCYYIKLFCN